MIHNPITLFNFSADSKLDNWRIVNDGVMGGRSEGYFEINEEGHGEFSGDVSLKNNGGFTSLRYYFPSTNVEHYKCFQLRIKGDGKPYQFRAKSDEAERFSYVFSFDTTGEWETIEVPFGEMFPSFRGRKLDMPNYPGAEVAEITFLIANNVEEKFKLEIDWLKIK